MEPLMLECIFGDTYTEENVKEVRDYIAASTGIQTILQMKWLAQRVADEGKVALDPWEYKAEYNRRLMINVEKRCADAKSGNKDNYIMRGSKQFLEALAAKGVKMYAASGTDIGDPARCGAPFLHEPVGVRLAPQAGGGLSGGFHGRGLCRRDAH